MHTRPVWRNWKAKSVMKLGKYGPKDSTSFLQVVVQKYLQNKISYEKMQEVFAILKDVIEEGDRFIAICVDLDLTYKITDALNYESSQAGIDTISGRKVFRAVFFLAF